MSIPLPDHRFGMTRERFNVGGMPESLPQVNVLTAANKLNEHRYKSLTHRQRVFVDAYLSNDFDPTLAAIEAGFPADEAERVGKRMLKKKAISQAIQFALQYFTETQKLRVEEIMERLRVMAFTNITDLVDPVTAEPLDLAPDDPKWAAVKKIKRTETKYGETIEYELHDKLSAIEKLLKLLDPSKATNPADGTTITNYIQTVNLLPVPRGEFLPPPAEESMELPDQPLFDRVIDHITP